MSSPVTAFEAAEIFRLRDRISLLEEDNAQLRTMIGDNRGDGFYRRVRAVFGLPKAPARMLGVLMANKIGSLEALGRTCAVGAETPSIGTVKVQMHRIRAALAPYQIHVKNVWGVGYSIDADGRSRLTEMLEAAAQ